MDQPNPTQPNSTQTLGSGILCTRVVGHVLPQKRPGSSDKMCSQTIIWDKQLHQQNQSKTKKEKNKKTKKHSIKVLYLLTSRYSFASCEAKPSQTTSHILVCFFTHCQKMLKHLWMNNEGVKGEDSYFFTLTHHKWKKSYISTIKYVFTHKMISLDFEWIHWFSSLNRN